MARPLRILLATALVLLAGCGGGTGVVTTAETEGIYLDINGLKYQIEMSRYMNEADVEDREYMVGLPESTEPPAPDETWFGVGAGPPTPPAPAPRPAANTWEIHDTQENVYRPIPLDTDLNPFAFEAVDVPPKTVLPHPSSAAGQGPIQGSLLLFKVTVDSLQNRPLELVFSHGGSGQEGTYVLDV